MKLNPLSSSSRSILRRAPQLAACGALAFGLQVACSDAPSTPSLPLLGASGNTTTTTTGGQVTGTAGMTTTVAGTFSSAAGTFSSAGTGTGGADTAGTGGQVTGGTGGSDAAGTGTAGTGGQVVATAYCMGKTPTPLPYGVTDGFKQSGWDGATAEITADAKILPAPAVNYCTQRAAGAVGDCSMWQWTPDPVTPAYSDVRWSRMWDDHTVGPQVCLPDGAKYISFYARGALGGEKISAGGCGIAATGEVAIVLTNKWAVYSVPLDGVVYNTFATGVENAFSWKAEPPTTQITFWIDNIQIRTDLPTIPGGGGGGTGGSGGTGGTGGGGTGGTN